MGVDPKMSVFPTAGAAFHGGAMENQYVFTLSLAAAASGSTHIP
jgi:hypothetical protein